MVTKLSGLLLLTGCTVVTPEYYAVVHCEEEGRYGPPACYDGQECIGGLCAPVLSPPNACCTSVECPARRAACW
jgi:hypothetical protein